MSHRDNILRIKSVDNALGDLRDKVVYVGGSTISLYADRYVQEVRVTLDVDVLVELLNYNERIALEQKLHKIGFENDFESGIICRYKYGSTIVDIVPTIEAPMGFTNRWYAEGFTNAVDYTIDELHTIKILTVPYFLATKLEAYKSRGKGDGRMSRDFEDIVFVLENRTAVWAELDVMQGSIKDYLKESFAELLKNPNIYEWVDSHVERGSPPQTTEIISALRKFCA